MRPILFHLGPLEIRAYGVLVALAFVAAWAILRAELARRAGRADAAGPLIVAAAVGGLVGARAYWFIEQSGSVGTGDLLSGAGFTWYGGIVGGALAVLVVAHRLRLSLNVVLASAAPALALGYAVGRVACQFAGDGTYGVPSGLPWAMSYPHGEVPTTERVHPTPIYETLAGLLIFAALWRQRHRMPPARLFGLYLLLSGTERFAVEFIRRNDEVAVGLTQPQLFALAFALVGAALVAWRRPARSVSYSPGFGADVSSQTGAALRRIDFDQWPLRRQAPGSVASVETDRRAEAKRPPAIDNDRA